MLLLTRRIGEALMIGDDVNITVLSVKGNQVRFGINAPKEIAVHREEIFIKVKAEQKALNAKNGELDISLIDAFRVHQKTQEASHICVNY